MHAAVGLMCVVVAGAAQRQELFDPLVRAGYHSVPPSAWTSGRLHVRAEVAGEPMWLLVDTGASVSVLDGAAAAKIGTYPKVEGAMVRQPLGRQFRVYQFEEAELQIGEVGVKHRFCVSDWPSSTARGELARAEGILGADYLTAQSAVIDHGRYPRLYFKPVAMPPAKK